MHIKLYLRQHPLFGRQNLDDIDAVVLLGLRLIAVELAFLAGDDVGLRQRGGERFGGAGDELLLIDQVAGFGFFHRFTGGGAGSLGARFRRASAGKQLHNPRYAADADNQHQHDNGGHPEGFFARAVPQGEAEYRQNVSHPASPTFSTKISCSDGSRISKRSGKISRATMSRRKPLAISSPVILNS